MRERRSPQKSRLRGKADTDGKRVTLPRALSKLGYCSRTQAERLIADGRVTVDGRKVIDLSAWVDMDAARIKVDGKDVVAEAKIYLMLNKPRGLVTTRDDPEGRPTVYDCLKDFDIPHLSPVGRLDKASEGLLLFTNDTTFAQALLDPLTHLTKTYHVQVDRIMDDELLAEMTYGVRHDGEVLKATSAKLLRSGDKNSWIEVELDEGRNRQIRRILEGLDTECLRLVRVAIGGLGLGDLAKGAVRPLTEAELKDLRRGAGLEKTRRN
ncbi:pseudouridine synthase [Rhizobium sp. S152]|uniref:pseudouridine synthase n=1 Tax=Rhizobium sp. S152 TaxID=3055038 RepID=UPI0025A9F986|nr:pseudouridine synthase [Rhizobium sp. S152]MDM9629009.1 pseudouridine synthase [Rhizobium sp. S152]